eukprot:s5152_g3.t1
MWGRSETFFISFLPVMSFPGEARKNFGDTAVVASSEKRLSLDLHPLAEFFRHRQRVAEQAVQFSECTTRSSGRT